MTGVVIDTFSRFSRALDPRFAYKAGDVVQTLERAGKVVGYPCVIRGDNRLEFVSRDQDLWALQRGVILAFRGVILVFSRPSKPTDNGFAEFVNGEVWSECLNTAEFMSLDDAHSKCEAGRRDYNETRLRSAIGDKCPIELMNGTGPCGAPCA